MRPGAPLAVPSTGAAREMIDDRYELLGRLGIGASGEVFRASDTLLRTVVAIKILRSEYSGDEEAIENLRQAVGINPKYYTAHFELASILDRIGELAEAVREYEVAEPDFRNNGEYWYRRGFTYYRLGREADAREALQHVQSIAPGSESAARANELLGVLD